MVLPLHESDSDEAAQHGPDGLGREAERSNEAGDTDPGRDIWRVLGHATAEPGDGERWKAA
jgi:hypothetical protein